MSISSSYPTLRPSLLLDFSNSGRLDPRVTFTRASSATYFDATGTLQTATTDVPRFDYDPSTLAAQGLLIEEARTNSIRNNTGVGAVAGTPGTLPTNWVVNNSSGLTTNVIGVGSSGGINYVDLQVVGTSTGTIYQLSFDANTQVSASAGQSWAGSFWVAQTAGTTGGITGTNVRVSARDSGGLTLATNDSAAITLTGTLARYASVYASLPASTAFVQASLRLGLTNGAAIDITLRIGLPQLELGAFATSVIPTTSTAVTRAADVASVNTLSPWYNAAEYTLYYEGMVQANSDNIVYAGVGDTFDNTIYMSRNAPNNNLFVRSGGASQTAPLTSLFTPTAGTPFKISAGIKTNDFAFCINGGTVATDTSGAMPLSAVRLSIGNSPFSVSGGNQKQQWIRRITYYPRKLSSAELQAITS